jgi:hypothetical protein
MRQRAMSAGAAFSGSVATACLGAALASGRMGPLAGFLAAAVAAACLVLASRRHLAPARLRLCPRRGVVLDDDGDGETPLRPVGVTPNLICLARNIRRSRHAPIWRDSLPPDGFRRIAAFMLWRRSETLDPVQHSELIARKTVTEPPSDLRSGRPPGP